MGYLKDGLFSNYQMGSCNSLRRGERAAKSDSGVSTYRADEDRKSRPTAASCSWSSFTCNPDKLCSGNGTLWTIWTRFFLFFLLPIEKRRFSRFISITYERGYEGEDRGHRVSSTISTLNLSQIWTSTFNLRHVICSISDHDCRARYAGELCQYGKGLLHA